MEPTIEKPDVNRDEMIMQQQRLIEKEVWPLKNTKLVIF